MSRIEVHIVPHLATPVRLSDYAGGIFSIISSRKGMKKAIDKGWVTINGRPANTADRLAGGERIELTVPTPSKQVLFELDIPVLYEDEHLAVVFKPAGLEVHGNRKRTIENALLFNLTMSPFHDAITPHCVHRLDRPTTGCLLVGKTRSSVAKLSAMFATGIVQKEYRTVTIGTMQPSGQIDQEVDGKPSLTSFKVIRSVASPRFGNLNLVQVMPSTGRRHQIRKHFSAMGNPILGDREYCPAGLVLTGKGLYLHAFRLTFPHPETQVNVVVEAPLPRKFEKLFP